MSVPGLDAGLAFYVGALGHALRWRNDEIGQAGLALPEGDTEIVLTTTHGYEPNWLVDSADLAAAKIEAAGGTVLAEPFDIPVGRVAVVADPFGNALVLVDLSRGRYSTDEDGQVKGVESDGYQREASAPIDADPSVRAMANRMASPTPPSGGPDDVRPTHLLRSDPIAPWPRFVGDDP